MSAPLGNKFWEARSSHGRAPIFATPDDLWAGACEYFAWVEANPLWEDKVTSYQGANTHEPIAKMRAMTVTGLCIFLDISRQAWSEYREREGFGDITARIDDIIRTQKFEGASAELLNANIIARDLGLADKSEITGRDGGPIRTDVTDRDLARAVALLFSEAMVNDAAG
ncbi:DNA-packaging protein [Mesorhizobium sp. M4B.F.Ca.ET.215.01.1.1]|uniref:DNA-packaging protein n=1 Tax=unclassified Mesorhizobium TaxID=325217 RepID=UPI00109379DE|nr:MULTISPECIES: DNA-packaging protein [unclassified Mesorhizobium]TGQ11214.1 DNA-packaging protein [Mesorhizobium sp. M4B.F.Ca.ET.215.01.1.1]TGR04733.1 DNA-packaging protein [Mesorhizobium sp. M4B.F.Ca.ET.203.01.1.1]